MSTHQSDFFTEPVRFQVKVPKKYKPYIENGHITAYSLIPGTQLTVGDIALQIFLKHMKKP